ncbi:MAG: UDP-4-amino-4,6-dideoxy-N-acetyl-beta-L-altrosamine transaminase [Marivibrio sp.]|uniref:UDP-4-amino-4, 6-dideoxy-N-acetyl-beta-L-altrosamine transaminase n=1 Tax=Marivibrio sp. TaxID=2039719 RepID=UPI0032EACC26
MIPYGRQSIDEDDIAAVAAALRSDYLTTGPRVEAFEADLAQATGAAHAVVCNSGTAALYIAARALGLGPGDVAIVPSMTFLATASAPFLAGAEIVFADVDPDTGLMRPEDLERAIAEARRRFPEGRLAAAFVVHLNGQCADMPALKALCDARDLFLVEDACHALGGATRRADEPEAAGREARVGDTRWSHLACFSFHPVKTIAMGEGGAVTTQDAALAEALRLHRNHGMVRDPERWRHRDMGFDAGGEPNPWYYELETPGLNFRVPDVLCALGSSQLKKLDRFVAGRAEVVAHYDRAIAGLAPAILGPAKVPWGRPAWHLFAARVDWATLGVERGAAMRLLRAQAVGTQVHYIPLHRQPFWERRYGRQDLSGAEAYYAAALSLPLFAAMEYADVGRVVQSLEKLSAGAAQPRSP